MNGLLFTQHVHMSVSPGALCSLHLHMQVRNMSAVRTGGVNSHCINISGDRNLMLLDVTSFIIFSCKINVKAWLCEMFLSKLIGRKTKEAEHEVDRQADHF